MLYWLVQYSLWWLLPLHITMDWYCVLFSLTRVLSNYDHDILAIDSIYLKHNGVCGNRVENCLQIASINHTCAGEVTKIPCAQLRHLVLTNNNKTYKWAQHSLN